MDLDRRSPLLQSAASAKVKSRSGTVMPYCKVNQATQDHTEDRLDRQDHRYGLSSWVSISRRTCSKRNRDNDSVANGIETMIQLIEKRVERSASERGLLGWYAGMEAWMKEIQEVKDCIHL